jgi:hypothetical protein
VSILRLLGFDQSAVSTGTVGMRNQSVDGRGIEVGPKKKLINQMEQEFNI